MRYKRPRGTQDFFGGKMERWSNVEKKLADMVGKYGYSEVRTPVFEVSGLFIRAVGEGSDIVSKEMYTFKDKKGRDLTLRPENTAPVMRAFLENGLHRSGGVTRFFYLGPMFRYDRPQAGRYRQFHQFGVEAIGSSNPAVDAEVIDISLKMYGMFGFTGLEVRLNSVGCPECRPQYMELLKSGLERVRDELCTDCTDRALINPLRIFDCKKCVDIKNKLPVITDNLCDECSTHFRRLQGLLGEMKIDFVLDPLLVRGLDYYTKTAFEILHSEIGAQSALCGGGRYDGLAEDCGGPSIPAVGFSAGMERLIENIPADLAERFERPVTDVFFIVLDQSGFARAMILAAALRDAGFTAEVELSGRAMKKQLRAASESGATRAIFIGSDEMEKGEATIKDMRTGDQEHVPFEDVLSFIRNRILNQ